MCVIACRTFFPLRAGAGNSCSSCLAGELPRFKLSTGFALGEDIASDCTHAGTAAMQSNNRSKSPLGERNGIRYSSALAQVRFCKSAATRRALDVATTEIGSASQQ